MVIYPRRYNNCPQIGATDMNFYEESTDFKKGYEAACLCMNRDQSKSRDWLRGFDKAQEDNEQGDFDPSQKVAA
jgi:hypothetical protein